MLLYLCAAYLALVHLSGLPRTHRTRLSEWQNSDGVINHGDNDDVDDFHHADD